MASNGKAGLDCLRILLNIILMARDLEYDISPEAYAVFKSSIELRMELGLFYNA